MIDVKLVGNCIEAIVDTAAQVTVINTNVFSDYFGTKYEAQEQVRLKCAGENQYLFAKLYKNIPIEIGNLTILQDLYVANISDQMLLGLDFLLKHEVVIDLQSCSLNVLDCFIPFHTMRNAANEKFCVSKVSVSNKICVPSKTVQTIEV